MLVVDLSVHDGKGERGIGQLAIVRGKQHPKLKRAFYYHYRAMIDGNWFIGDVVHTYENGAVALTQKVTKAIVGQQKAARNGERH
jgi:hypothetical protein